MAQMKELYEKVARDNVLQLKFVKIIENEERLNQTAVGEKLVAFAKDAGYSVTLEEMKNHFMDLSEAKAGELSEADLDMVAGGKSANANMNLQFNLGNVIIKLNAGL